MEKFDIKKFIEEYKNGDIWGLEYLEKTLITEYKEENRKLFLSGAIGYTKYDYVINLFYATKELNTCNDIYETDSIGASFDYDIYFKMKDLLFSEIGKLEKIDFDYYIDKYC